MKKSKPIIAISLLLCVAVCLSGCGLIFTTPSLNFDLGNAYGDVDYGAGLPIYGSGIEKQDPQLPSDGDVEPQSYRPYYGLGSNKELSGRVLVFLIFVDTEDTSWTYSEIQSFWQDQAKPAFLYLIDAAESYGIELDFEIGAYATVMSGVNIKYEGEIGSNDKSGMPTDVLESVAKDIGFETADAMLSNHRQKYSYEEIAYINVFDKAGRSYTYMQSSAPHLERAEHCVVFADAYEGDQRLYESRSVAIAHELLHLYGAEDLYEPETRAEIAKEFYPTEIMLIASTTLEGVSFSELTAYWIGWHDTVPEICLRSDW